MCRFLHYEDIVFNLEAEAQTKVMKVENVLKKVLMTICLRVCKDMN